MKKQPIEDKKSLNRVRRGASWNFNERGAHISYRIWGNLSRPWYNIGFRVVRNKPSEKQ